MCFHMKARSANSNAVNATVRIFMAPRFSRFGELFSLAEQRRLYFPLDNFQVTRMLSIRNQRPLPLNNLTHSLYAD